MNTNAKKIIAGRGFLLKTVKKGESAIFSLSLGDPNEELADNFNVEENSPQRYVTSPVVKYRKHFLSKMIEIETAHTVYLIKLIQC